MKNFAIMFASISKDIMDEIIVQAMDRRDATKQLMKDYPDAHVFYAISV